MSEMRLLVAGSRGITDRDRVHHVLNNASYVLDRHVSEVIHGDAPGVDRLAGEWAEFKLYPVVAVPAAWQEFGKSAGYRRNLEMVAMCDAAIVIWDGESRGTRHTLNLLAGSGKPHVIVVERPNGVALK